MKIDLKRDDYLHPYPAESSIPFCLYCGIGSNHTVCQLCGSIEHYVVDKNKINKRVLDFPTAFAIQRNAKLTHDPECSFVQTNGALLCDCSAIEKEYARLIAEAE